MRRENKLALIVGFSVLLVVAVLVSDHLSKARQDAVQDGMWTLQDLPDAELMIQSPLAETERVRPRVQPRVENPAPLDGARAASRSRGAAERGRDLGFGLGVGVGVGGDHPVRDAHAVPAETEPQEFQNGPGEADGDSSDRGGSSLFDWQSWWQASDTGDKTREAETDPAPPKRAANDARVKDTPARPASRDRGRSSPGEYKVEPGDTLIEICTRVLGDGTRWREVAAMNAGTVGENGRVYVGTTLKMPAGGNGARTTPNPGRHEPKLATRTYTVRKGDTLSQIAQREVGSVRFLAEIRDMNPALRDGKDRIVVGQKLVLPVRAGAGGSGAARASR